MLSFHLLLSSKCKLSNKFHNQNPVCILVLNIAPTQTILGHLYKTQCNIIQPLHWHIHKQLIKCLSCSRSCFKFWSHIISQLWKEILNEFYTISILHSARKVISKTAKVKSSIGFSEIHIGCVQQTYVRVFICIYLMWLIHYKEKSFQQTILWKCWITLHLNFSNPQNGHQILHIKIHQITMFGTNLNSQSTKARENCFDPWSNCSKKKKNWKCTMSGIIR